MTATPVKLTRIDVALLPVWKKWQLLAGRSSILFEEFPVRCMGNQLRSNQCGPPARPSLHQASGPLKTWIKWLSSGLKIRSKKPCPSWPSKKEKHTQASDCVTLVTHNRSTSTTYIYKNIYIYAYTLVYIYICIWFYIYPALSTLVSRDPRIIHQQSFHCRNNAFCGKPISSATVDTGIFRTFRLQSLDHRFLDVLHTRPPNTPGLLRSLERIGGNDSRILNQT